MTTTEVRRFRPGMAWTRDGVHYRTIRGIKGPEDIRLDWLIAGEWIPVSLEHVALILDVIGENENYLYPNGSGNGKVLSFVEAAIRYGYQQANYYLMLERARKRGQASNFLASLRSRSMSQTKEGEL